MAIEPKNAKNTAWVPRGVLKMGTICGFVGRGEPACQPQALGVTKNNPEYRHISGQDTWLMFLPRC